MVGAFLLLCVTENAMLVRPVLVAQVVTCIEFVSVEKPNENFDFLWYVNPPNEAVIAWLDPRINEEFVEGRG